MAYSLVNGDCLTELKALLDESAQTCITSPPYWGLRDYGTEGQLGLEETPEHYVTNMVQVFREVKRVLRDDGTLWLNLGDSYANSGVSAGEPRGYRKGLSEQGLSSWTSREEYGKVKTAVSGLKPKDLVGIPWRVAFALQADGWYLRSDIIWHKPNPMPESVTDRPTKAHEYIFLLSKNKRYYYDHEAIKEASTSEMGRGATGRGKQAYAKVSGFKNNPHQDHSGWCGGDGQSRNKRSVWTVATQPFSEAHFATFPPKLIEPCVLAGCPHSGTVLDPFAGAGTTLLVAENHGRNSIGIELNPEYCDIIRRRMANRQTTLFEMGI